MAGRVAAKLRKALPKASVEIIDIHSLKIKATGREDATINLDRIQDYCSVNDAANCRSEEDRFVTGVIEMATNDYVVTKTRLRVIVRNNDYVSGTRQIYADKPGKDPVSSFLAGDVAIMLAADFPNTTRIVSTDELSPFGLDRDSAISLGTDQVLATLPPVPKMDKVGGKLIVIAGYDYGASMLLRPERWRALAEATKGDLFVAILSDDNVLVGTAKDADFPKLREMISVSYSLAGRGISPQIYRWSMTGSVVAN
jgi:hypothetical protein